MRRGVQIVILLSVIALGAGRGSFAASAPPKNSKRQAEPYIYLEGGVRKPGRYDWIKGMTLVDAVDVAGGFKESACNRVNILHFDGTKEHFDRNGTNAPPACSAGDRISVPSMPVRIF